MRILYPTHPLSPRRADDQYAEELAAVEAVGFHTSLLSVESLQAGEFIATPQPQPSEKILYRGWMLTSSEYKTLEAGIDNAGAIPLIPLASYLSSHHLPNWYPKIADLTPETRIFPADCDLASEIAKLNWPESFIKDYVKSLKTAGGSRLAAGSRASLRGISSNRAARLAQPCASDRRSNLQKQRYTPQSVHK